MWARIRGVGVVVGLVGRLELGDMDGGELSPLLLVELLRSRDSRALDSLALLSGSRLGSSAKARRASS